MLRRVSRGGNNPGGSFGSVSWPRVGQKRPDEHMSHIVKWGRRKFEFVLVNHNSSVRSARVSTCWRYINDALPTVVAYHYTKITGMLFLIVGSFSMYITYNIKTLNINRSSANVHLKHFYGLLLCKIVYSFQQWLGPSQLTLSHFTKRKLCGSKHNYTVWELCRIWQLSNIIKKYKMNS